LINKAFKIQNKARTFCCFFNFLILLILLGCASENSGESWYTVKRVVDGDTFIIDTGKRVRMIGIDTPESVKPNSPVEPYGKEASEFAKKVLEGKRVKLEFDVQKKDKYGRLLAYVYLEDGTFVNALLVKEGYAKIMTIPPNIRYAEDFLELQEQARRENKGLWGIEGNAEIDND